MEPQQIEIMRKNAKKISNILAGARWYAQDKYADGITLKDVEHRIEQLIEQNGVESVNKGFVATHAKEPYPSVCCLSLNNGIAHGIPTSTILKSGDILNIDLAIKCDGLCADASETVPIGQVDPRTERLLRYARRALYVGIEAIAPRSPITAVGDAIEKYVHQMGYVVNKTFVGHRIKEEMHMDPIVPHFRIREVYPEEFCKTVDKFLFQVGEVYCLEPSITYKDEWGAPNEDGWTFHTRDGRNSAMFEHMILIKEDGIEILTDHIKDERATE